LWQEAKAFVDRRSGLLVLDDTTLDKPYAKKMDWVSYHWSGKHQRVVKGINLLTLLWTDGNALIPCDFRIYDPPFGGKTKNEHFREMLRIAKERGFEPEYVLMDSWYSSLGNLKFIASQGWLFLTRLKSNRRVNPDGKGNIPLSTLDIPPEGRVVHLRGFGWVKVFRKVSQNGGWEYWATNDLQMREEKRAELEKEGWGIELYHRGLKQCCGVERAQVRNAVAILNHLLFCLRAFLRLEVHRLKTGISWYEAKFSIIRVAIRWYLAHPTYSLHRRVCLRISAECSPLTGLGS